MRRGRVFLGCLCALGCEVIYGVSYLFTKESAASAGVFALLGWRFLVAAIAAVVCAAVGILPVKLKGKRLMPLIGIAMLSPVLYFIGETYGIRLTTVSESGAFIAVIPVLDVLASLVILKKKPTKLQLAGILLTFAGVMMTVFAGDRAVSLNPAGYAMLTLAVVSFSVYSVCVEKADGYTGAEITFAMILVGAAVFGVLAVGEAVLTGTLRQMIALPFTNAGFLTAIVFQGVACSILASLLNNLAFAWIGVNRTSTFIGVSTVVSVAVGLIVLREPFSAVQLAGTGVILAGVYTANSKHRTSPPGIARPHFVRAAHHKQQI